MEFKLKSLEPEVKECRRAQKDYFLHRKEMVIKQYLDAARKAEAELDKVIASVNLKHDRSTYEVELFRLASDMRHKQRVYFQNRSSAYGYRYLNAAKAAEKRLDDLLASKLLQNQTTLF
jgi:hypothetical protein